MDQEISPSARDDLDDLPDEAATRLLSKFEDAGEWPEHYLTRLSGYPYYKLRAGDYRAIIDWDKTNDKQEMLRAGHRDGVYDW